MGFDLVAIGTSLGGLQAMTTLLGALPVDFSVPVLLVQHRSAGSDDLLPALLQACTPLHVSEVYDKQPLERGMLYVAPTGYHLLVARDHLCLSIDAPVHAARPSIDVLLESVATAYGREAIAVLLTGASADGAGGAAALKQCGGVVLVQDPTTAESPVLPLAVLARTPVDAILALPDLANKLDELTRRP